MPRLTKPPAMLAGIETAERRNWRVRPNLSSGGNFCVSRYTQRTNWWALCQIKRSRNVLAKVTTSGAAHPPNLSFWLLAPGSWLLPRLLPLHRLHHRYSILRVDDQAEAHGP